MAELIDLAARRTAAAPTHERDQQTDLAIEAMVLVSDLSIDDLRVVISLARSLSERRASASGR